MDGDFFGRWARGARIDSDQSDVVRTYLAGGNFQAVAAGLEVSRATAWRWVAHFFACCSFFLYEQDARVVCEDTHGSSGGDGGTPATGRREHSAGTCSMCTALAGATWDGWITIEDDEVRP